MREAGIVVVDRDGEESEFEELGTLQSNNNIHAGIPHNLNFSKVSTLVEIMEAQLRTADEQVRNFDADSTLR